MTIRITSSQKSELEAQGYSIELIKDVYTHRRSYWDPRSNSWTAPLPGDPMRMRTYLRKGFLLEKPQQEVKVGPEVTTEGSAFTCPDCGFEAKDKIGLKIHSRAKHNPKRHYRKHKHNGG